MKLTMNFTPVKEGEGMQDVCTVESGAYQTKLQVAHYKVWFEPAQGGTDIPAKYRRPTTTDLVLEATGGDLEKDWDLK